MIDLLNPVPGIGLSQFFGARPTVYKRFGLAGHEGVDYACPRGTPVMAAASGEVWRAGDSRDAGQIIGHSGETGNATGPHLHFALALPAQNAGYACPSVMGAHWWHDPLLIGDARMAVRGGQEGSFVRAVGETRCVAHGFQQGGDVW